MTGYTVRRSLTREELDQRIDGYSEDCWEHYESPQAKAHRLLKDLDLVDQRACPYATLH